MQTVQDSMKVKELFTLIEKSSEYKIYAAVDENLRVAVDKNLLSFPPQLLERAFVPQGYQVSCWGKQIFVLKDRLYTGYPVIFQTKKTDMELADGLPQERVTEKADSENRLYSIGKVRETTGGKLSLSGIVYDFKTGERVSGANIRVKGQSNATITNAKGEYSLEIPDGYVELLITSINVQDTRRQVMLYEDGQLDIVLEEKAHQLDEVVISRDRIEQMRSTQLGVEKLQPTKLKNIPMAMGEADILKVIQALPGVKTVGEASTGFNVRGGATDQNLILLNDGVIYNPNHLFGFFSAFNSDMIKEAEIYKSSVPEQYGGRISSILDIHSKTANKEKFTGSAGIGLVTSKLNLEIPVIKEKTSLLLSGRTTYSDWIMRLLPEKSGYKDGKAGFYDLGAVLSHQMNDRNNLYVYGYHSYDRFSFNVNEKYNYTNMNYSAKWRSVLNEKLLGDFTVGYGHYGYTNRETVHAEGAYELAFDINQWFAKIGFELTPHEKHKAAFGAQSIFYNVNPGKFSPYGAESIIKKDVLQKEKTLESAFYVGDDWEITPKLSVHAGVRYSVYQAMGPKNYHSYLSGELPSEATAVDTVSVSGGKVYQTYHGPEFRVSARYAFNDYLSFKAGFNSMRQYIHKLSNTVIMSPTDTWKLSDVNVKPQEGWQAAVGWYLTSPTGMWEYSLEGYWKQMKNYLDYKGGAQLIMNHHIETDVVPTEGKAYGIEMQIKKQTGRLNGWLSYTYARTFLQQNDARIVKPVNDGDWYPTEYDKPHDIKFVGNYKFTKRYSMSLNVDYSTGRPTTIPAGQYYDTETHANKVYYTDRNSYRIPDYFRMDVSFNIEPSHKLTLLTHSSISIGVYNVTGRKNVYSIYYVSEDGQVKGYKMSIFGIPVPFITYNIKF
ncbi:MAG: TonB-dependent receptor [Bacteroides sp.]|nr:TonB-dependent receptor [Bacteroides sp.]